MIEADPPAGVDPFVVEVRVRFADVDGMGHANNAKYLTYLEEARSAWSIEEMGVRSLEDFQFIIAHARIDFVAAAQLGDTVRVAMWVPRISARSWDFAYVLTDQAGKVLARALTTQVAYDYKAGRAQPVTERHLASLRGFAAVA